MSDHKFKIGQAVSYVWDIWSAHSKLKCSRSCRNCRRRAAIANIAQKAPASLTSAWSRKASLQRLGDWLLGIADSKSYRVGALC